MLLAKGNPSNIVMIQPDGSREQVLMPGRSPSWQAGHEHFVFMRNDGTAWIANGDGNGARPIPSPPGMQLSQVALSPDGSRVVGPCAPVKTLCVASVDGATQRAIALPEFYFYPSTAVWLADGHRVAFTYNDIGGPANIAILNVDDAVPTPQSITASLQAPATAGSYSVQSLSPDGTHLALIFTSSAAIISTSIEVMDLSTLALTEWSKIVHDSSSPSSYDGWYSAAGSPDGQTIAVARGTALLGAFILRPDGGSTKVPNSEPSASVSWG